MSDDLTLGPGEEWRALPRQATRSLEACIDRARMTGRALDVASAQHRRLLSEKDKAGDEESAAHSAFAQARRELMEAVTQPAPTEEPNAHTLTLEFWRFLSDEEFRTVVSQVRTHVPHIRHLHIRSVRVPDHQVADGVNGRAESPAPPAPRDAGVLTRHDCVWNYCPSPDGCRTACAHPRSVI